MTKQAQAFAAEQSSRILAILRRSQSSLWDRFASGDLPKWQMKACRAYINDILTEEADRAFMDRLKVEDENERLLTEYTLYAELGDVYCRAYYYRHSRVCDSSLA